MTQPQALQQVTFRLPSSAIAGLRFLAKQLGFRSGAEFSAFELEEVLLTRTDELREELRLAAVEAQAAYEGFDAMIAEVRQRHQLRAAGQPIKH